VNVSKKSPKDDKKEKTKGKHAGGRPKAYTDIDEMQDKIDEYFKSCFEPKRNKKGIIQVRTRWKSGNDSSKTIHIIRTGIGT